MPKSLIIIIVFTLAGSAPPSVIDAREPPTIAAKVRRVLFQELLVARGLCLCHCTSSVFVLAEGQRTKAVGERPALRSLTPSASIVAAKADYWRSVWKLKNC